MKLHKRKKHDIPQGDANDSREDEPEDNSERESEPVADSTMIKSTKKKMCYLAFELDAFGCGLKPPQGHMDSCSDCNY